MTYIDTNIFIYLFENHPKYGEYVAQEITALQKEGSLLCSVLTVTECLAGTQNVTLETFHALPDLQLIPLDEHIAARAADLQQSINLRIGDAIHLATAVSQEASVFFTNDLQLATIASDFMAVKTLGKDYEKNCN